MTNRQWLASLTNFQLSQFLTDGLWVVTKYNNTPMAVNIQKLLNRYEDGLTGIQIWLECSQEFDVLDPSMLHDKIFGGDV